MSNVPYPGGGPDRLPKYSGRSRRSFGPRSAGAFAAVDTSSTSPRQKPGRMTRSMSSAGGEVPGDPVVGHQRRDGDRQHRDLGSNPAFGARSASMRRRAGSASLPVTNRIRGRRPRTWRTDGQGCGLARPRRGWAEAGRNCALRTSFQHVGHQRRRDRLRFRGERQFVHQTGHECRFGDDFGVDEITVGLYWEAVEDRPAEQLERAGHIVKWDPEDEPRDPEREHARETRASPGAGHRGKPRATRLKSR